MKLGVRARLFLVSFGLVVAGGLITGAFLDRAFRDWFDARLRVDLAQEAEAAAVAFAQRQPEVHPDELADSLGAAFDARVTLIAADGRVLGDSEIALADLAGLDSHRSRPEVADAVPGSPGHHVRVSSTLGQEMVYVAVRGEGGEVTRVAVATAEISEVLARVRWMLLTAGGIGMALALAIAGTSSAYISAVLRRLWWQARTLTDSRGASRIPVSSSDELAGIAVSMNAMAEEVGDLVSALAEERARLEAVLDALSEAVIALDESRRVLLTNRSALDLLGVDEPPIGRPLADLVRAAQVHEIVDRTRRRGEVSEVEWTSPDGRVLYGCATPGRSTTALVLVLRDVSQLRRLEQTRKAFVTNVSHELRTPVAVIQANAETLLKGAMNSPRGPRFVEAIHRNAERLANLISDLMDLSKVESGQASLEEERIDLVKQAAAVVEDVSVTAGEKDTQFVLDLEGEVWAMGDAKAVDQILVNLLQNAIRYTPVGARVELRAWAEDGRVRVEVRDDGPGIAPHHWPHIFERFYRVDPGRAREMGGTGLGLSIVKNLVQAMGGRVGVGANQPHGAVFWFDLPAADIEAQSA